MPSSGAIQIKTLPKVNCPMGRGDRHEALSRRASYPEGSDAGDAMEKILDFVGVDHGVVKDLAYDEPWDDDEARTRCHNPSRVRPILGKGWTDVHGRFDERKQLEPVPEPGDKFFIADLRSACQCGYKATEPHIQG